MCEFLKHPRKLKIRFIEKRILDSGSKIFGTDNYSLTRLVVGTFLGFLGVKIKKDSPAATSLSKNTLERISQHG